MALHVHRDDRSTRGVERLGQPVDHRDRGVVDVRDMPEVEDHEVGVFETRDDRAVDLLGSGEEQVTLQLVQHDGAAPPGDGFVLGNGADTIGDDLVAPHDASDDRLDSHGRAQQVQLQVTRHRSHDSMPRTLLPRLSSGGENTPMAGWPGSTAMTPPATPLFAGRPTL